MKMTNSTMVDRSPADKHRSASLNGCLLALLQIGRVFGFRGTWAMKSTKEHWIAGSSLCGWEKFVKYKLASYFSAHRGLELPPAPEWPRDFTDNPRSLVGGRLGRFLRLYLKLSDPEMKDELLFSIKMAKKGMPRSSDEKLDADVRKTVQTLTSEGPQQAHHLRQLLIDWADVDDTQMGVAISLTRENVETQLRRTVDELFPKGSSKLQTSARVAAFFPSTSANYIRSRSGAGAVGAILESGVLQGLRTPGGYLKMKTNNDGEGDDEMIEEEDRKREEFTTTSVLQFEKAFETVWLRCLKLGNQSENIVEPVGLKEALKNRIITKGNPWRQTILRALWKHLHTTMRKHPAFSLIGSKPVDAQYVQSRMGADLKEGEAYLSGDYAAATDNMHSWVSEVIALRISENLGLYPVEERLFVESLTRHIIKDVDGSMRPQKRGQLMGSITSFVVLCIANATTLRWSREISTGRVTTLKDAPMMVNGDDGAVRLRKRGEMAWLRISAYMGLESSIGKTYYTSEFVEINSRQFTRLKDETDEILVENHVKPHYVLDPKTQRLVFRKGHYAFTKRQLRFRAVKFVNLGLLVGMKRSAGGVGLDALTDPIDGLASRYETLLRDCPSHLKEEVHKAFVARHRLVLAGSKLPWYIPTWLGGVGLIGLREPSDIDRRIAAAILWNWTKRRPVSTTALNAPWKTWQLAQKGLPPASVSETQDVGTERYTSMVSDKCVDLLFDSTITLDHLYKVARSDHEWKNRLRHNERLWEVKSYTKLPPPMTREDMLFSPKYQSYDVRLNFPKISPSTGLDHEPGEVIPIV